MNYRHAYHAGNFADVVKHAVLARAVALLSRKEAPFRVLDTHAGTGLYDLSADEAMKTGEWQGGVGRVIDAQAQGPLAAFLAPWRAAVRAANGGDDLLVYPGSPVIAAALGRPQDRFVFAELHPVDGEELAARFAADRRVRVMTEDGWTAVRSQLPPPERRGLTMIDPPFEASGEFDRLARAFRDAARRFATGVVVGWYPRKSPEAVEAFHRDLAASGLSRLVAVDHWTRREGGDGPLRGAGMVILNPPWPLADELAEVLPHLSDLLATGAGAGCRVEWLAPERSGA